MIVSNKIKCNFYRILNRGEWVMKCPQCEKEMTHKNKHISYYGIADWDMDYPTEYDIETFKCKDCKISCTINHEDYNDKTEWKIPDKFLPTEKQIKTVNFINSKLRMDQKCPTKKSAWEFINTYFDTAKKQTSQDYESWCEDNMDWLPEYY